MTYIYGLFCPVALTIRYVGKSDDPERRLLNHVWACGKNTHHTARWLASLKRKGLQPEVLVLAEVSEGEDWQAVERRFIASGPEMGWKLTNSTPGGEGGGWLRLEDKAAWMQKVRAGLSSPEVRAKISDGVRKAYDKPGARARAGIRAKRNWEDPDYRLRVSEGIAASMGTSENRKKAGDRGRAAMAVPGAREALSEKMKSYYATEEGKANKLRVSEDEAKREASRQAQKKNWEDPKYRERQLAAKRSPEALALQKEKARQQWADPEVRARMAAAMKASIERRKEAKANGV